MSHPTKQPNKLQDQLFHKISILLDKPISKKSTQQITNIIQHVSSPKQKILTLLMRKYRSDLILKMVHSCPQIFFNQFILTELLNNIQKNILNYANNINNFSLVMAIWNSVINLINNNNSNSNSNNNNKSNNNNNNNTRSPNQTQHFIYRISYENLLKQSITSANLQKKQRLFQLIYSNIKLFCQLGMKDNLRKVVVTFVQVFKKYPIIVVSYVKTMRLIVQLVYYKKGDGGDQQQRLKQMKQKKQQQKTSPISLYQLPTIPTQHMIQITQQLTTILITTKQKPLHLLHNQCIKTLILILTNMKKNKNNDFMNNEHIDTHLIFQLNKMLQIYLYNKGTRQQARKLVVVLNSIEQQLSNSNKQKMIRDYSFLSQQSQSKYLQKINKDKPVLIQNVIQRTNQYMAKYHVNKIDVVGNNNNNNNINNTNNQDNSTINQPHNKVINANNYLKKGQGMGGGRAVLQINLNNNVNNNLNNSNKKSLLQKQRQFKKKDKYQLLLQDCLLKSGERQHQKQQLQQLKQQQLKSDRIIKGADMNKYITNTNTHIKDSNNNNNNKKNNNIKNININKHTNLNNKKPTFQQQQFYQSIYSQFYQPQQQQQQQQPYTINNNNKKYHQYDQNNNRTSYSNITQDDDVNQINQLIDLAYSYKFTGQY